MNSHTGAIIILAYPEEFVSMIPAWYRKPMEWVGMVNHGKVAAGHSAMALVNKATGKIYYGDFGRYITPFGYGRTRMEMTDPDVVFDYKVEFKDGMIVDKKALFQHIYEHPEKTHGGDVMYISLNQDIDFDKCLRFMTKMNDKGSIIYDPFGKGRSNCSRFVYDTILAGVTDKTIKKKLKRKSPLTPSPLGNVFHGTNEDSHVFTPEGNQVVKDKSIRVVIKHLFKKAEKPSSLPLTQDEKKEKFLGLNPKNKWSYLGGVGDEAYILARKITDNSIMIEKYGAHQKLDFVQEFELHKSFDPDSNYEFIHDCNASWITVIQDGKKLRMNALIKV